MSVFLVTRTDGQYEPLRIEAAGAADIRDFLAHQDHLQEMVWLRRWPPRPFQRSFMKDADIIDTKDPPEYRLVRETYGSKLVRVLCV